MDGFTKGPWQKGLFEVDPMLCIVNYFTVPCSLAQIHEKLGNPSFGKPVACVLACCGFGGIQILWYGQKAKGESEPILCGILKTWLCGICYLHQQYKEHGCPTEPGKIVTTAVKPAQIEMS